MMNAAAMNQYMYLAFIIRLVSLSDDARFDIEYLPALVAGSSEVKIPVSSEIYATEFYLFAAGADEYVIHLQRERYRVGREVCRRHSVNPPLRLHPQIKPRANLFSAWSPLAYSEPSGRA